jgi:hypothetical protein
MREPTIENVVIKSTMLGVEDHGIFTAYLNLEGDGWGCSFGGYGFDEWDAKKGRRIGHAFGIEFINRVLEVAEVDRWEKLPGTKIRCKTTGLGGGVTEIGHFMKNKWFNPKTLAAEFKL